MITTRNFIISLLKEHRGDDLDRARHAFRNYTPAQMNAPYGQSDKTPAQIIAGYEQRELEIDNAIDWVEQVTI